MKTSILTQKPLFKRCASMRAFGVGPVNRVFLVLLGIKAVLLWMQNNIRHRVQFE